MTDNDTASGQPTVALVHGAFADSSSWNGVVELLLQAGVAVQAVSNPLRGIGHDSAYVAKAIAQIPGPVLAVGHSYGGAIITNAVTDLDNVVGLVYVAAFAPDNGELLSGIEADSTDSVLNSALRHPRVPGWRRRDRRRALHRPGTVPSRLCRRRPARPGGRHGRHPTPGGSAGLLRPERAAGLEEPAFLGRGRQR